MNQNEFINGIRIAVEDTANKSIISTLIAPAGRKPSEHLVELSRWYNSLNEADKKMVSKVIQEAVDSAIFGFLCVIDGVRAIENSREKGVLNLYYQNENTKVLLNDPDEDYLHDIW